ncbi:MAG: hypothetical protein JKY37_02385 [Nannocystaceae bacterium]|nr:hypothetical protein [Nannocystaceae bacterium]
MSSSCTCGYGLVSTKEADVWLAHYVRMGFYYVAMRYDPPRRKAEAGQEGAVLAETMRISFDTPLPYYPYLEPEPLPALAKLTLFEPRLLELWVVGREEVVPVALREHDGQRRWVRPLHGGRVTPDARKVLEAVFEDEVESLLPPGALVVQTFQDQKNSRKGFADVLFAPKKAQELSAHKVAKLVCKPKHGCTFGLMTWVTLGLGTWVTNSRGGATLRRYG